MYECLCSHVLFVLLHEPLLGLICVCSHVLCVLLHEPLLELVCMRSHVLCMLLHEPLLGLVSKYVHLPHAAQHLDKDKNGKVTMAEIEDVGLNLGFTLEQTHQLFKRYVKEHVLLQPGVLPSSIQTVDFQAYTH